MAELKGVGPATASGAPVKVPFMADETMDSVPGLGTIAYTIPYYIKFATKVIEKAAELKKKGSTIVDSPHLVEKALWTEFMLNKYGIQRKIAGSSSTSARVSAPASTQERKESNATKAATKEDGSSSNKNSKRKAEEIDAKATGTGIKHQKQTSASAMKTKSSTTPASTPAPAAGVRRSARSRS
ncbi:hypothetical protein BGZ54_000554 [Gamsiella multidivaricata]|nr:hypothetical protein BGZ54_000554 [Gamsiella multidivaricata]